MQIVSNILVAMGLFFLSSSAMAKSQSLAEGCSAFQRAGVSASLTYDHQSNRFVFIIGNPFNDGRNQGTVFEVYNSVATPLDANALTRPLVVSGIEGNRELRFGTKFSFVVGQGRSRLQFRCLRFNQI